MLCCTVVIVRLIGSEEDADHEQGCSRHEKQEKICKALARFVLIILREKKEGSGFVVFGLSSPFCPTVQPDDFLTMKAVCSYTNKI